MPNYQNSMLYEVYHDYGDSFYVGSTVDMIARMGRHYNQSRYVKPDGDKFHVFWKAEVLKAGKTIGKGDGFHMRLIRPCPCNSLKELWAAEYGVIDEYIARGKVVLNDMIGGKMSVEAKKKMSDAHIGHIVSDDTRKKISDANIGRIVSDDTRKKMSDAMTGKTGEKNNRFKFGCVDLDDNGSGYLSWRFSHSINGASKSRKFSISKYGNKKAEKLALVEQRKIYGHLESFQFHLAVNTYLPLMIWYD